jgi:hypothetical protein
MEKVALLSDVTRQELFQETARSKSYQGGTHLLGKSNDIAS